VDSNFRSSRDICDENLLNISGQQSRRKNLTSHVFGSLAPVKVEPQTETPARKRQANFFGQP
jgi:hypothetical protein